MRGPGWGRALAFAGWLGLGCGQAEAEGLAAPPLPQALTLLHTADLHSRVWPFRARISRFEAGLGLGREGALVEVGGFARLASALERERGAEDALWLDSGDALEGAAVFQRFGGLVELELLSALGLSAMALGNHELSLSAAELASLFSAPARPRLLAANLEPRSGSSLAGVLRSSVVVPSQGVELAVIGVANPESPPDVTRADNAWDLERASDVAAAVQAAMAELPARAQLTIVLSHLGLDRDRELVRGTSGIDLVLGGHQHLVTTEPEEERDCQDEALQAALGCQPRAVPIVHSGAYGKLLSRLELGLVAAPNRPGKLAIARLSLRQVPLGESEPESPAVRERLRAYEPPPEAPWAFARERLARRSALGGDSALGNLAADAQRATAAADVVVLNSSGLRADLEAGVVLASDVSLALPFEEPWIAARLPLAELRRDLLLAARRSAARDCVSSLQVSGLRLRIDCSACRRGAPACLELALVGAADQPLSEQTELLVAVPSYMTQAGSDFESVLGFAPTQLALSWPDAMRAYAARLETTAAGSSCVGALETLSPARCREAFGADACPLAPKQAEAVCRLLPQLSGARDDRIIMLP